MIHRLLNLLGLTTATVCISLAATAQTREIDSMVQTSIKQKDTGLVFTLCRISSALLDADLGEAMNYAQKAYELSTKIKSDIGKVQSLNLIANISFETGNLVEAMDLQFKVLRVQEDMKVPDPVSIAASLNTIGRVYQEQRDYVNAILYYDSSRIIFEQQQYEEYVLVTLLNMGDCFEKMNNMDSALIFQNKAYELAIKRKDREYIGTIHINLGNINLKLGNLDIAQSHYRASLPLFNQVEDMLSLSDGYYGMARVFEKLQLPDSALYYARKSYTAAIQTAHPSGLQTSATLLSSLFEKLGRTDSAYAYYKTAMMARDTLFNEEIVRKVQTMGIDET